MKKKVEEKCQEYYDKNEHRFKDRGILDGVIRFQPTP